MKGHGMYDIINNQHIAPQLKTLEDENDLLKSEIHALGSDC